MKCWGLGVTGSEGPDQDLQKYKASVVLFPQKRSVNKDAVLFLAVTVRHLSAIKHFHRFYLICQSLLKGG